MCSLCFHVKKEMFQDEIKINYYLLKAYNNPKKKYVI